MGVPPPAEGANLHLIPQQPNLTLAQGPPPQLPILRPHVVFSPGLPNRGIILFSLTTPNFFLKTSPARRPGWLNRNVGDCATSTVFSLLSEMCLVWWPGSRKGTCGLLMGAPIVSQSSGPQRCRSGNFLTTLNFPGGRQALLRFSRNHGGRGARGRGCTIRKCSNAVTENARHERCA